MAYLIQSNLLCLLLSLLLGLLVGWWMWARAREAAWTDPVSLAVPDPVIPVPPIAVPTPIAPLASPFLATPSGAIDDLKLIKGVGPKLNDVLNSLGVFHFRQIAGWTAVQVGQVDDRLGAFSGRIVRDRWQDQARLLGEGRLDEFRREFGEPGSEEA